MDPGEDDDRPDSDCACPHPDAYTCWTYRYSGLARVTADAMTEETWADGGPCECPCHDQEDGD